MCEASTRSTPKGDTPTLAIQFLKAGSVASLTLQATLRAARQVRCESSEPPSEGCVPRAVGSSLSFRGREGRHGPRTSHLANNTCYSRRAQLRREVPHPRLHLPLRQTPVRRRGRCVSLGPTCCVSGPRGSIFRSEARQGSPLGSRLARGELSTRSRGLGTTMEGGGGCYALECAVLGMTRVCHVIFS